MMMKINVMFVSTLLFTLFIVKPAAASNDCSAVTIDNDTSDWKNIEAIVSDGQDLEGVTYYYDGSNWSTTASSDDLYSTDIISMQDLENVKMCNSATQLQLYIDAQHPLLAYQDLANETYFEFGDPNGSDGELGLPATLDYWLVFKLQEADSTDIYYYAVYLYAEEDDLGLEQGPRQIAIYQESEEVKFSEASFNPNEDGLLVEIDSSDEGTKGIRLAGEGGKNIDASGGFESGPALMNKAGEGLFNLTNISYGDTLNLAVQTYDGSQFEETKGVRPMVNAALNDQTDKVEYRMKRAGVTGVNVPASKLQSDQVQVKWDELSGVTKYQVRLLSKTGKALHTTTTEQTKITIKNLESNQRYQVQVRAKIGSLYTPWSEKESFKTTE